MNSRLFTRTSRIRNDARRIISFQIPDTTTCLGRHCEKRSDEAIQGHRTARAALDRHAAQRRLAMTSLDQTDVVSVPRAPELLAAAIAATDWQSLDAQTDADILRNVADDTDAAPILAGRETAASMANRANPSTCRKPTRR